MLHQTFQHLPGIGPKTETRLWDQQVDCWDRLLESPHLPASVKKNDRLPQLLKEPENRLRQQDVRFFENKLPSRLHWRFFPQFRNRAVYLDIETDGLDPDHGGITTIALFDGRKIACYIRGHNMDAFVEDIRQYDLIITYNGKCFDIPFLETYFQIRLPQAQIDLRYVLASLGYKGGLKQCEARLGMDRGNLADVDGFFAVLLWKEYQRTRSPQALETLLAYNVEDTVNLEQLMVTAYNLNLKQTPFWKQMQIPFPESPVNPYTADDNLIRKLKTALQFQFTPHQGFPSDSGRSI